MMVCSLCGGPESARNLSHCKSYRPCQASNCGVCIPCKEIGQLELQISQAEAALAEMIQRHHELKSEMNHVHNPIIHRVPSEIASSIFESCVPDEFHGILSSWNKTKISALLNLGAVCRTWRQIAWSTPRLWTSIFIFLDHSEISEHTEIARGWLNRSGQLPLSIYVSGSKAVEPLIDLVNCCSSRWQHINLSVHPSLLRRFSGDKTGVSILQTLWIVRATYGQFILENTKPSPSTVDISTLNFKSINIAWENVTSVEVASVPVNECLELLRCAPKVDHCKLRRVLLPAQDFLIPENPFIHQRLRDLTFLIQDDQSQLFFKIVTLPSLTNLCYGGSDDRFPNQVLLPFLQRSACLLTRLSISDLRIYDKNFVSLLKGIPSLRELRLLFCDWRRDWLDQIFKLLGNTALIPNDHSLEEKTFLPCLQYFLYDSKAAVNWNDAPDFFGSFLGVDSTRRGRPLTLDIRCPDWDLSFDCINREFLAKVIDLQNVGINLKIIDVRYRRDLLQIFAFQHGIVSDLAEAIYV